MLLRKLLLIEGLLTLRDFALRRQQQLDSMLTGSVALVLGATRQRRNRDIYLPFRQDSDFNYLRGFCEPDAFLVLMPGRVQGENVIFCRERDGVAKRCGEPILGPEAGPATLAINDSLPISDVADILPGLLEGLTQIYMNLGEHFLWDNRLVAYLDELTQQRGPGEAEVGEIVALGHLLRELRLIKSAKEQQLMRQAAHISVAAQNRVLEKLRPGLSEAALEAELIYSYRAHGATAVAYPSIVAAGDNPCSLHYSKNESVLSDGGLVLIDAGCEFEYYAADVTRTYPISSCFSDAQRCLYDIVLAASRAAIAQCAANSHLNAPHEAATTLVVKGLSKLGLIEGDLEEIIAAGSHEQFCPHKTSHWLGLDVHDVADYRAAGAWRDLLPGMVLTVEPGIYIPCDETTEHIANCYRGIGIRIEDVVLITQQGCEVVPQDLVKDADAIEVQLAENFRQHGPQAAIQTGSA